MMAANHGVVAEQSQGRARSSAEGAAAVKDPMLEDTETPKGTLTVLLMYAGVIVLLWGYMYLSMLLRR